MWTRISDHFLESLLESDSKIFLYPVIISPYQTRKYIYNKNEIGNFDFKGGIL